MELKAQYTAISLVIIYRCVCRNERLQMDFLVQYVEILKYFEFSADRPGDFCLPLS